MSNTGPDLATGDGPYPIDGKVVEIEYREDGTFVYIVQTSTTKYTLACSRKMLEKYSVPVRCFKAQAGQTVHVSRCLPEKPRSL